MQNIFEHGEAQTIATVLKNRDQRVAVQQHLLKEHPQAAVIAAKLNIPGPIKNNHAIMMFFQNQLHEFEHQLTAAQIVFVQATEWLDAATGPERFYVCYADAMQVKHLAVNFEEQTAAHRLFDLDVLMLNAQSLMVSISRSMLNQPARKCFLCGKPAKVCGRARTHTVTELQQRVNQLISIANQQEKLKQQADILANLGVEAMIDEVSAWPKPGLVDPVEHAAHPDMDYFLFVKSALALRPYLVQCAYAGLNFSGHPSLDHLFDEIREFGKRAEHTMFQTTNGVNTHKGAIFSLGVMITAVGVALQQHQLDDDHLQAIVRAMLLKLVDHDLGNLEQRSVLTAGEQQYYQYQLGGIRTEAAGGYQSIFKYGLPAFKEAAAQDLNARLITTLMTLARHATDSTLIKRAGSPRIIAWKDHVIDAFFAKGGMQTTSGRSYLRQLQQEFAQRQLSLGGSADLLIVTVFIAKVERRF